MDNFGSASGVVVTRADRRHRWLTYPFAVGRGSHRARGQSVDR